MGYQQNPDQIYVPPGINRRYPLGSGLICPVCMTSGMRWEGTELRCTNKKCRE